MNLMLPDSGLLFWMTVIFAIVFFVLAKFGFPVITGMVEKRTERIEKAIGDARKAEEALASLSKEHEEMLERTRAEQARILQDAAAERDRLMAEARRQAAEEAGKILEDARGRILEEKEAALRDVRREVARLSVAIAEDVLKKELSSEEGHREFLGRMLEETPRLKS